MTRTSPARIVSLLLALPGAALGVVAVARYAEQWPPGFHPILFGLVIVLPPTLVGALAMPLALLGRGRGGAAVRPSGLVTALGLWAGAAGWVAGVVWLAAPLWPTHVMAEIQMSPPAASLPTGPGRVVAFGGSDGALSFDVADGRFAKWGGSAGAIDVAWTWRASDHRLFVVDCGGDALIVRSVTADGKSAEALREPKQDFAAQHVDPCACQVTSDGARLACTGSVRPDPNTAAQKTYLLVRPLGDSSPVASRMIADAPAAGVVRVSPDATRVFYSAPCAADADRLCLDAVAADGTGRIEKDLGSTNVCSVWPSPDGARVAFVTSHDRCDELWLSDAALSSPRLLLTLVPTDTASKDGINALAWAPGGGSVAVESDHDGPGCSGSEGVSSCLAKLFTVDLSTAALRQVSPRYVAARALVWTP